MVAPELIEFVKFARETTTRRLISYGICKMSAPKSMRAATLSRFHVSPMLSKLAGQV